MARGKTCVIRMDPFMISFGMRKPQKYERGAMDTDAEAIYKYILDQAGEY